MFFNTYKKISYQLLLFATNANASVGMNEINKLNLFDSCIGKKLKDINIDTDSFINLYIGNAVTKYLPSNEKSYNGIFLILFFVYILDFYLLSKQLVVDMHQKNLKLDEARSQNNSSSNFELKMLVYQLKCIEFEFWCLVYKNAAKKSINIAKESMNIAKESMNIAEKAMNIAEKIKNDAKEFMNIAKVVVKKDGLNISSKEANNAPCMNFLLVSIYFSYIS